MRTVHLFVEVYNNDRFRTSFQLDCPQQYSFEHSAWVIDRSALNKLIAERAPASYGKKNVEFVINDYQSKPRFN